jgi:ribosome-associated protein
MLKEDTQSLWRSQALNNRTQEKINVLATLATDKLAYEFTALNVSQLCSYTDVLLICHGSSSRQVQAIASHIRESMKKECNARPLGMEGMTGGQWIVIDYGDVIVHVFHQPVREYYDLEGNWADAIRGKLVQGKDSAHVEWPDEEPKQT